MLSGRRIRRWPGSSRILCLMIEVDAAAISPDELILRVQSLLAETPRVGVPAVPYSPRNLPAQSGRGGPEQARQRAEVLHQRFKQLGPPDITSGPGPRWQVTRCFVKRVVRKLTAWYIEPRWTAQIDFDAATVWAATESANVIGQQAVELQRLSQSIERIERMIEAMTAAEAAAREVKAMVRGSCSTSTRVSWPPCTSRSATSTSPSARSPLCRDDAPPARRGRSGGGRRAGAGPRRLRRLAARLHRLRGPVPRTSAAELKELQRSYLPLFGDPLEYRRIIDIGCGRGEMLELLEEAGFQPVGVDTDVGMLALCRSKDLDVVEADAVLWLQSLEPESIDGIFSAEVIEHLPTEALVGLVSAAHRGAATRRYGARDDRPPLGLRPVQLVLRRPLARASRLPAHVGVPVRGRRVLVRGGPTPQPPRRAPATVETLPDTPEGAATGTLLDTVFGHEDYALVARK